MHKSRIYRSISLSRWWRRGQQNRSARVSSSRSRTRFFIPTSALLLAFSCLLGFVFMLLKPAHSAMACGSLWEFTGSCPPYSVYYGEHVTSGGNPGGALHGTTSQLSASPWRNSAAAQMTVLTAGTITEISFDYWYENDYPYATPSVGIYRGATELYFDIEGQTVENTWHTFTRTMSVSVVAGDVVVVHAGYNAFVSEAEADGNTVYLDNVEITGAVWSPTPTPTMTPTPRQIISQANTPTMTPTGAVISDTLPTHVPTWTPDAECASGANPYGWGRVTPDPLWIMQCAQCVHIARTPYPTYAPDSSGSGTYNFYNRCTAVVPASVGNVDPRGDPKTFYIPGMDLSEPECLTFQEWTVSFLDPVIGIEDVGLPEISICIISVTFGNIVFFGYIIPVDEILGTIVGMRVLFWFFFGRGGA